MVLNVGHGKSGPARSGVARPKTPPTSALGTVPNEAGASGVLKPPVAPTGSESTITEGRPPAGSAKKRVRRASGNVPRNNIALSRWRALPLSL